MGHRRHKGGFWSELHPELLTLIADRLKTRDDFLHFRSVCSNWRSSIHHIPNNLPILSPIFPQNFPSAVPYHGGTLTIVATFLIQNPNPNFPKPWLVTVEELNPGKLILRKPLESYPMEGDYPRFLDLSQFRIRKIREDYNFRRAGEGFPYKVLLFSDHHDCGHPTSVYDCYALVLDQRYLSFRRLKERYDYGPLQYGGIKFFDDIVCYKGAVWAIDKKGRVYVIRYHSQDLRLRRFAANGVGSVYATRKCLIESVDGLYLLYTECGKFIVYKLNEVEHKWCEVKDLDGRILFVSFDRCFFASVEDFPGYAGDCIIFPTNHYCSLIYSYHKGPDKVSEIGVFHFDDSKSGLITTYPGYSEIFWPPPCWLFSDTCPSTNLLKDDEETESEIPTLDTPCASNSVQIGEQGWDSHASKVQNFNCGAPWKTFKRHIVEPDLRDEEENEVDIPTLDAPCASNGVQIGEQVSCCLALKIKLPEMDAHPMCRDYHASTVQNFNHDAPGKTLERYSIQSNLIPTLEKIWEKHGNITEGCTLRTTDMISSALESLATTVLILKKNTGRSLSDSQADYLSSSLSDLKRMRFKVGWLAPFVEMALAIKKSRRLVDSLKEFNEAKARAQESKMKLLDELAKLDEVEDDLTLVMDIIPVLEEVNLEKGLGEGLY